MYGKKKDGIPGPETTEAIMQAIKVKSAMNHASRKMEA
jgi:hypothetical protein